MHFSNIHFIQVVDFSPRFNCALTANLRRAFYTGLDVNDHDCDTAQGKDAPRGNFLMIYAEYLGRYNKI